MSDDVCRRYVVGLGANLGDRVATLKSAVTALGAHGGVLAVSDLYETSAVGPPQPDYLNAAVLLESALAPTHVMRALLDVEQRHGRERRERWGPRTLDLDLLHSPALVVREPTLTLPHPELGRRAFALAPLLDVLPDAVDPVSGARFTEVLGSVDRAGVRRFAARAAWDPRPNS
jgi:2-amino-4-hydroxy-6-hydroxymethyldihydropteridine diphosphokinase